MSSSPLGRRVHVIQIQKVGQSYGFAVKGDLSSDEVVYGLRVLEKLLIDQDLHQNRPGLDLKVRRMP